MIDLATILFSTGMCLVVVLRAIRLDGAKSWFGKRAPTPDAWRPRDGSDADAA
jgi:hypothetical protein